MSVLLASCGTAREKLELFFGLFQGTALGLSRTDVVEALASIHHVFGQQLHDSAIGSYLAVLLPGSAGDTLTVGQCVDATCAQQLIVEALRLQVRARRHRRVLLAYAPSPARPAALARPRRPSRSLLQLQLQASSSAQRELRRRFSLTSTTEEVVSWQ